MRNHLELNLPYPAMTGRAQFLIDHPWYVEAGEDLQAHKKLPLMSGDYHFKHSNGHKWWSLHAMKMTNVVVIQTHRGTTFALLNETDAA